MKDRLHMWYDKEGDVLEVRMGKARNAIYEDMGDDVFVRKDEKTNKVSGFTIIGFKKRTRKLKYMEFAEAITN